MLEAPLKYACTDAGQYGLNVEASAYVDSGIRLLRTSDLGSDGRFRDDGIFIAGPVEQRFLVAQGDLLLSRSGTIGQAFLVPDSLSGASFAGFLVRFRPDPKVADPRYLHYVTQSGPFQDVVASEAVASTISNFNAERYSNIRVPLPPVDVQRRIADFLDDQVAIMERAGLLRDTQLALVADAFDSSGDKALTGLALDGPPLSAVATIVDTEHKTAPTVPGGQRWIAGTSAIREGTLRWEHLRETDREHFAEWTRRAAPRAGDVLLTREAPVGEVALLRSDDPQVAIGQRVVLLRPSGGLDGGFLRAVLMSSILHRVVNLTTQGSLHPHLNMSDIARIRIPVASLSKQHEVAQKHAELLERFSALRDCLTRARELMEARKRSLITAAVTGVFDVTSASSRPAEVVLAGTGGAV